MPSKSEPLLSTKLTAACGILGMLVFFLFTAIAIMVSPWFSWIGNALSDLGNTDTHMNSALVFNSGLIAGGIILVIFLLGLRSRTKTNTIEHIATLTLLVAAIAFIGVGIFPENIPLGHLITAMTMFLFNTVGLFMFGVAFILSKSMKMLGVLCFILALASTVIWVPVWGRGVAIPEMIAAVAVYVLIIVVSIKLVSGKNLVPKK